MTLPDSAGHEYSNWSLFIRLFVKIRGRLGQNIAQPQNPAESEFIYWGILLNKIVRFYSNNKVIFVFSHKLYNIFMIEEEFPISIEELQNKFQKWFGKPVPADPPFPAEVEHSIGNPAPADLPLTYEADHSIGGPVPVAIPLHTDADHLNHETRRRGLDNPQKLSETLNLGFSGAVFSGAVVGAIIVMLNLSFPGWYSDYWPSQFIIIVLALLLGFNIGLSKGYISHQREKYFYNGEL